LSKYFASHPRRLYLTCTGCGLLPGTAQHGCLQSCSAAVASRCVRRSHTKCQVLTASKEANIRSMPLRASPSQLQPQKHLTAFDVTRVTPTFNTALQKSHCFCDCCGASFNIDGATSLKSHCSLCGCSNSLKV